MVSVASPTFTIVTSVLNAFDTIERCIESISNQSFRSWELIVVDGGSTDGTVDVIRSHQDAIAHWESGPDTGVFQAWNKALPHVKGDWILFLGADDFLWDSDALARVAAGLERVAPPCRVAYGKVNRVNDRGDIVEVMGMGWQQTRRHFRHGNSMPHQATFHHRTLFDDHGSFDESFRLAGDFEFLLRELVLGEAFFLDTLVSGMQLGGLTTDPRNSWARITESVRIRRRHRTLELPESVPATVVVAYYLYREYLYRCRRFTKWWLREPLKRLLGEELYRRLVVIYRSRSLRH